MVALFAVACLQYYTWEPKVTLPKQHPAASLNSIPLDSIPTPLAIPTEHWMQTLADSLRLHELILPGSHDAGISVTRHCNPFLIAKAYAKTQQGSMKQQLLDGARYFDIRVDWDHGELVTYHRSGSGLGCNGQSLQEVLEQTIHFLEQYPSEGLIIKCSHIRQAKGHDAKQIKAQIDRFLNGYQAYLFQHATLPYPLAELPLGLLRGKLLWVMDYPAHIAPAIGRFRYLDAPLVSHVPAGQLCVYDMYSNSAVYENMAADQLQKWTAQAGKRKDQLFLLSWTLTPKPPGSGVKVLTKKAHQYLPAVLHQMLVLARQAKPNIVYLDFIDAGICRHVIQYNFLVLS